MKLRRNQKSKRTTPDAHAFTQRLGFGERTRRREDPHRNVRRALAQVQDGAVTNGGGPPEYNRDLGVTLPGKFQNRAESQRSFPLVVCLRSLLRKDQCPEHAGAGSEPRGDNELIDALGDLARRDVPVEQPQKLLADERK